MGKNAFSLSDVFYIAVAFCFIIFIVSLMVIGFYENGYNLAVVQENEAFMQSFCVEAGYEEQYGSYDKRYCIAGENFELTKNKLFCTFHKRRTNFPFEYLKIKNCYLELEEAR